MGRSIAVCIGGTGVRCFEAFLYSVAAGQLAAAKEITEITVLIVDKDSDCQTILQCKNALMAYESYRHELSGKGEKLFPLPKIALDERWDLSSVLTGIAGEKVTLKNATRGGDARLIDALFTYEEQEEDLIKGFYGHPSIGATLFDFITEEKNNTIPLIKDIADRADGNTEGDMRAFLFGSVFGGTGAAILPNIARMFKTANPKVKIGAAVMLPYFDILTPEGQPDDVRIIRANNFFRASSTAIRHYAKANMIKSSESDGSYVFDTVTFIGSHPFAVTSERYANGGKEQFSHKHVLDMCAALASCEFFTAKKLPEPGMNTFVTYLSTKDEVLDAVRWENLPTGDTENGSYETKDKLCQFVRFCAVMAQGIQLEMLKPDEILQKDSRILKAIFGQKGLLSKKANCDDKQREAIKSQVSQVFKFCRLFLEYMNDVAQSGRNWASKDASGDYICALFNRINLEKLHTYAQDLGNSRNAPPVVENLDELTTIGEKKPVNTEMTLTDVMNRVFSTESRGKYDFASMMKAVYDACSIQPA